MTYEFGNQLQGIGILVVLFLTGWIMFKIGEANGRFEATQELETKHSYELVCANDTATNGWRNASQFLDELTELDERKRGTNRALSLVVQELRLTQIERDEANRRAALARYPVTEPGSAVVDIKCKAVSR